MDAATSGRTISEAEFAELVTQLGGDGDALCRLLEESHAVYEERGTAATVRMRGWVLLALTRIELPDTALPYVLEELDTGHDAYTVAAAARALRSRHQPDQRFAVYVARAIVNVRARDDLLSFDSYGAYVTDGPGSTAVSELLATLRWIGPLGRHVAGDLASLIDERHSAEWSEAARADVRTTLAALCGQAPHEPVNECCGLPWSFARGDSRSARPSAPAVESMLFEDHDARHVSYGDLFGGRPTFVVFFYTRCDNPRKCSLSIAKLARVQRLLEERGLSERVRTAAITYDPGWDAPERLRGYALGRGVRLDDDNRVLRCDASVLPILRAHFGLGVNYIESLVNRHRVEAFALDARGQVAIAFERLQWDEREVVECLVQMGAWPVSASTAPVPIETADEPRRPALFTTGMPVVALAVAFMPKCPICWAAYLSLFGIAGLERLGVGSWLLTAMIALVIVNLISLWWRERATGRMWAFSVGLSGAFAILVLGLLLELPWSRQVGVLLTVSASVLSVASGTPARGRRWRVAAPAHRSA